MSKKKKIILTAIASAVLIIALIAVFAFRDKSARSSNDTTGTHDNTAEEQQQTGAFYFEYSERLCGYPAGEVKYSDTVAEVRYGSAGFTRKVKTGGKTTEDLSVDTYDESAETKINGNTVTLKGTGGLIYLAEWEQGSFSFVIYASSGVTGEEMSVYVESTG